MSKENNLVSLGSSNISYEDILKKRNPSYIKRRDRNKLVRLGGASISIQEISRQKSERLRKAAEGLEQVAQSLGIKHY